MIFLWIFNTSICHNITVKYKFTNLPRHQKGQIHFSGDHIAGFHQCTPRSQNHIQFIHHIHTRLHISRLLKSHVHLWPFMVCILQSFSTIGSISLNRSRHGNFDRPCSTAGSIPDTFHPFKHALLPSSDVISLYISISHFACNGFILDSFSGTSIVCNSLLSSMASVIWLAHQSVNFLFISVFTKPFGPP